MAVMYLAKEEDPLDVAGDFIHIRWLQAVYRSTVFLPSCRAGFPSAREERMLICSEVLLYRLTNSGVYSHHLAG